MLFSAETVALVAPLASLLFCTLATALPYASPAQIFGLEERQQDITIGNVATEDELTDQIAGDGTGAMRTPNARSIYLSNQATATFYQIDLGASDADASYTSFVTVTSEAPSPVPTKGIDPRQTQKGPDLALPAGPPPLMRLRGKHAAQALGSALTVFDNLISIPNGPNQLKRQVFTYNLTGAGNGPGQGNDATYYAFEGVAIRKNLIARQDGINGVITAVANELKSAGNNENAVSDYFVHFGSVHYQGAIDFLETWTGRPVVGPRTVTAGTTATAIKASTAPSTSG
ncbi:hypothetical protein IMSHALPRED_004082 [Imshaugia aleurites]|uniref:Uncharacterized protein n=1 Tax=Imshaugia aleurites TaxID=172621 RepID=A0A8H3EIU4_9LECA|nr:hypothetical protein IMSHALPRED_004082 [Imshaugia aleurites]